MLDTLKASILSLYYHLLQYIRFFFFLLRTLAICVCGVSGIVAVNNPSAYNKSLRRAIDVPFQAARAHCKYKIFITRLHTLQLPADICMCVCSVQCPFSLILSFDCTDIRCKHFTRIYHFLLAPQQFITFKRLVELSNTLNISQFNRDIFVQINRTFSALSRSSASSHLPPLPTVCLGLSRTVSVCLGLSLSVCFCFYRVI